MKLRHFTSYEIERLRVEENDEKQGYPVVQRKGETEPELNEVSTDLKILSGGSTDITGPETHANGHVREENILFARRTCLL